MKGKWFAIMGGVVAIIIVLIFIYNRDNSYYSKVTNDEKVLNEFVSTIDKTFSDYDIEHKIEDNYVVFSSSEYDVEYRFEDNKIESVKISFNLYDNTLSGEDTVKKIEEFYKLVVDSFDKVDLYLNDDILDNKEHYSLNKYDRKHLVDLIDFVELCSDWDTSYSYRNKSYTKGNKNSMTSVSYSLYSKYDNEGYSYFYISIY